jgi:NADP-dependent 3-hydroxy acid dehydrogenase YdfG
VTVSKIWLITGSSRGLGRALPESVLAAGEKLIATARDVSQLDDFPRRFGDTFATQNDIARRDSDEKWRELSISTDFSPEVAK